MGRPRRFLHALTVGASLAVLAWWLGTVPAAGSFATVVMLVALALSITTFAVVGALAWRPCRPYERPAGDFKPLTILVVATADDSDEKLLTSVALAQGAGEVIIGDLAPNPRRELAADLDVLLLHGDDPADVGNAALAQATGEAFCILTAQACAVAPELRVATAAMHESAAWLVAETRPYNEDRFAPAPHVSTDDHIDELAEAWGLRAWACNATIVRTRAARDVGGFEAHRPWGSLLRRLAGAGWRGCRVANVVCVVSAPSEPTRFWRNQVWKERARVAEAADAMRRRGGGLAERFAGLAVTLRALHGIPSVLWVLGFGTVAVTGDAFTTAPLLPFTLALCATALLRTLSLSPAVDPVRVNEEIVRTVYRVPGSLSALPGLSGRAEPIASSSGTTTVLPARPLLLVCLLLGLAIGQGILRLLGTVPGGDAGVHTWGAVASGAVLLMLIEAIAYAGSLRRSGRDSYRFPLDVGVRLNGMAARTDDISAGGLRCRTSSRLAPDQVVTLTVDFVGQALHVTGVVRHVAPGEGGTETAGIRLAEPVGVRCRWVRALFAEAGILERAPVRARVSVAGPLGT